MMGGQGAEKIQTELSAQWGWGVSCAKRCHRNMVTLKNKVLARVTHSTNTPKGSRTPVFGLRTRCPRPLDDGGVAEQCDSSGQHWPFQVFDPKTLETSLSILPRTSRRPPPWRRQTSPSNCKTNCKTKCCKRACYGPHST